MRAIMDRIDHDVRIKLPDFDRANALESDASRIALVGIEANAYSGTVGEFRYQFEGEDDLLHLFVLRIDGSTLTVQEGQQLAGWLLPGVPLGLIWLKPGSISQHFYVGHDLLQTHLIRS
ncbi:MAG: hypothetical protein ACOYON_10050 [Fimbriimonas sp.]